MKAIIFGITGQDGSYLAELLHDKGYEVIGVTRRVSVDTLQRISHILPQIKIIEGDITDAFSVSNAIKEHEPDEVYNLAAQSHVGTSFTQPSLTWDVTAGGCLNVLEGVRYSGRKEKIKFYQASSSEMFGKNFNVKKGRLSVGDIMCGTEGDCGIKYQDEDTPFAPQSPYAIAKLAAHHLVRNYRDSYGIFACSGILFNHESERRGEKFVTRKITKWIGEFVRWHQENPTVFENCQLTEYENLDTDYIYTEGKSGPKFPKLRLGNLDAHRDWGHAKDYVRAMWMMMQHDKPDDYVVATGESHTIHEFLDEAFFAMNYDGGWQDLVVIDPKFYRPAEVDYLNGVYDKIETTLGWEPEYAFEDLVAEMVEEDL